MPPVLSQGAVQAHRWLPGHCPSHGHAGSLHESFCPTHGPDLWAADGATHGPNHGATSVATSGPTVGTNVAAGVATSGSPNAAGHNSQNLRV